MKLFRLFKWLLPAMLVFFLINCNTVFYGLEQGYHQLRIVVTAKPIEEYLKDNAYPDSLKKKIELISHIRKYAIDSLKLNDTKNYTTMYDQKGEPVLWVVVAAPEFEMEQYEWRFPFAGKFPYKGYFKEHKAKKEAKRLDKLGYDTDIGEVEAWSTLGILSDPILSNVLSRSEGELARLIIHEMTHATIYKKNSGEFNENIATFIGDEGAKYFLKNHFGANSKQTIKYMNDIADYEKYTSHLLRGSKLLDSLYSSFNDSISLAEKRRQKKMLIDKIVADTDSIVFFSGMKFSELMEDNSHPNNAFFTQYMLYRNTQKDFRHEYSKQFNSDLITYISHLKNIYND